MEAYLALMIPIVAILSVFGLPALVIVFWIRERERTKQSAHKLLSEAMARGQTVDPAVLTQLSQTIDRPADRPRKTLGSAVVMLALAGGFAGAAFFTSDYDPEAHSGMMTVAVILGALGAAFLILALVDYANKKKTDVEEA